MVLVAAPGRARQHGSYQYVYTNDLHYLGNVNRWANIWEPRFEGQPVPQYDSSVVSGVRQGTPWVARRVNNFRDCMEVSVLSTNNVAVASSGDDYDVRFSVSNNYQKGIVHSTRLNVISFNLSLGVNFSKRLRFDSSLNLSFQNLPNIPQGSLGPESETSIFRVHGSSSWSVADMRDSYMGPQGVQQYYAEYGRDNNPYFVAYEWLYGYKGATLDELRPLVAGQR